MQNNRSLFETRLGDLEVDFFKGVGLNKQAFFDEGDSFGIHYGQLFTEYGSIIQTPKSRVNDFAGSFKSKVNDVLMPTSDVTPNGLAKASCISISDVILGGDILVIRANPETIFGPYLSYVIRNSPEQIKSLVSGTTVYHIYAKDMKEFRLFLPSVKEQKIIVDALSQVDSLVSQAERLLDKYDDIRQGMAHDLLTGKVRLV